MIKIVCYQSDYINTNCYGISDGESYIIIDPAVSYKEMDEVCEGKIAGVLFTHGHFDHIQELQNYIDETDVKFYGYKKCLEKLNNPYLNASEHFGEEFSFDVGDRFISLNDADVINLLNVDIEVVENLGHTDCCISFIIDKYMFVGDFIFFGGIGRTDLPTGSSSAMKESLERFKKIVNDYVVYPGHGGKTTVSMAKDRNPYLR